MKVRTPTFVDYLVCNLYFCQIETQKYNKVFLRRLTTFFVRLIFLQPTYESKQSLLFYDRLRSFLRILWVLDYSNAVCTEWFWNWNSDPWIFLFSLLVLISKPLAWFARLYAGNDILDILSFFSSSSPSFISFSSFFLAKFAKETAWKNCPDGPCLCAVSISSRLCTVFFTSLQLCKDVTV